MTPEQQLVRVRMQRFSDDEWQRIEAFLWMAATCNVRIVDAVICEIQEQLEHDAAGADWVGEVYGIGIV